ncbi:hypothetical protein VCHA39O224_10414 [Vibrio chagasii]|nr:hypothetical protein VCHA35P150_30330 [Vibrio chagasii]CAH7285622.1 hypothetical protein VCHA39O224_10414 [Vibrio chagasii]CAK2760341.1 hypothetical protein VCRA217O112_170072 [Vibrio crassostreae]
MCFLQLTVSIKIPLRCGFGVTKDAQYTLNLLHSNKKTLNLELNQSAYHNESLGISGGSNSKQSILNTIACLHI